METKLHQIFQLCLDISKQHRYKVLFFFGSDSQIADVSIYDNYLAFEDLVYTGKVYTAMSQGEEQADQLIQALEIFKSIKSCVA